MNLATLDGHLAATDPDAAALTFAHVGDRDGVSPAGDLDGDGLADLLVGSLRGPETGALTVVWGRRGGGTIDARDPGAAWLTVAGRWATGSAEGCRTITGSVAPGDMDGDGTPDLVVEASTVPAWGRTACG